MTKFHMAAVAVLVSCGLLAAGAGSASAQAATPLAETVPITGTAKNGNAVQGHVQDQPLRRQGRQGLRGRQAQGAS